MGFDFLQVWLVGKKAEMKIAKCGGRLKNAFGGVVEAESEAKVAVALEEALEGQVVN